MIEPTNATKARLHIHYEQPLLGSNRRHSLWYGGDVLVIPYRGWRTTLRAAGDVDLIVQDRQTGQHYEVKDRSCHGIFGEKFFSTVLNDDDILRMLEHDESPHNRFRLLENTDTNWWEAFVEKDGILVRTAELSSEFYDEAITEILENIDDIVRED